MSSRLPIGDLDSNYSVIGQNMRTDPGADQMFHSTIMQVVLRHVGDYGELVRCLHVKHVLGVQQAGDTKLLLQQGVGHDVQNQASC